MVKKRLRDESSLDGREIWKAVDLAASRAPEWIKDNGDVLIHLMDEGMQEIADGIDAQQAEIDRLRERVGELESLLNMRERTIDLLSDSIHMLLDGLDANSPNEDPGREGGLSTDEWEKRVSAARAALEDK